MLLTSCLFETPDHHFFQPDVHLREQHPEYAQRQQKPYLVRCILQFDLQIFIEVHDRFVRVADLAVLLDHPSDLPVRKRFSLCAGSSLIKTLLLNSPFMTFWKPLDIFLSQEPESLSATLPQ